MVAPKILLLTHFVIVPKLVTLGQTVSAYFYIADKFSKIWAPEVTQGHRK